VAVYDVSFAGEVHRRVFSSCEWLL